MLTYYKRKWLFCGYTICLGMLVALLTIFQGVMLQIVVDTVAGNLKIHFGYIIAMTILYVIIYFCINYLLKLPTRELRFAPGKLYITANILLIYASTMKPKETLRYFESRLTKLDVKSANCSSVI